MKKDLRTRLYILSLIIFFVLTGCNVSESVTNNSETSENSIILIPNNEEYSYTSNLKYEYRNLLSEKEKMWYDAFSNYLDSYNSNNLEEYSYDSTAVNTLKYYNLDHPESELFENLIEATIYEDEENNLVWKQEYDKKLQEIDAAISDLVKDVNHEDNLVTKYRLIYNYLTRTIEYDFDEFNSETKQMGIYCKDNHNIYGAIIKKKAVCDGISDAFKYICTKCNLECVTMRGDLDSTIDKPYSHQWNIIPIYGHWFLIDCTFDLKTTDKNISELYWSFDEENKVVVLKSKLSYFLYYDITVEGRMPYKTGDISDSIVYGYETSTYSDDTSYSKLTLADYDKNTHTLYTEEGISFTCNEYFDLCKSVSGIGFSLTSDAFTLLAEDDYNSPINDSINLSTNAKIVGAMYFDMKNLYKVDKYDVNDLKVDFSFPDSSVYLDYFTLLLEYQDKIYEVDFFYLGL